VATRNIRVIDACAIYAYEIFFCSIGLARFVFSSISLSTIFFSFLINLLKNLVFEKDFFSFKILTRRWRSASSMAIYTIIFFYIIFSIRIDSFNKIFIICLIWLCWLLRRIFAACSPGAICWIFIFGKLVFFNCAIATNSLRFR